MSRKERIDLLVMVVGFCLIGYAIKVYPIIWASLGVGAVSLVISPLGKKVVWLWLKLSEAIGYVMSRVLLTIVFFIVLFPVAMIYQMGKKDKMKVKNGNLPSMWVLRNHKYSASNLENPW